jgi:hypothetical protein
VINCLYVTTKVGGEFFIRNCIKVLASYRKEDVISRTFIGIRIPRPKHIILRFSIRTARLEVQFARKRLGSCDSKHQTESLDHSITVAIDFEVTRKRCDAQCECSTRDGGSVLWVNCRSNKRAVLDEFNCTFALGSEHYSCHCEDFHAFGRRYLTVAYVRPSQPDELNIRRVFARGAVHEL